MKKKHCIIVLTMLLAGLLLFTQCGSMRIPYRRLPGEAKTFITAYFPTRKCIYAEQDRDDGRKEYKVKLNDGTEIEFYATGDWKKVDCKYAFLPLGILPETLVADLDTRCPGMRVYKAKREYGGYKISIPDMIYAADGTFIRNEFD